MLVEAVSPEGVKTVEVADQASCADVLRQALSGKKFKSVVACRLDGRVADLNAPCPATAERLAWNPSIPRIPTA